MGFYPSRGRLSELVERVEAGEEVLLTRHGRPEKTKASA
ncbi:MAG: type II toxin-antitoxin system prevent-host-death family antitoxin [Lysobacteraceae bacterium]|nr:MAG: type II toxin-antitoxin system prevent-host-death family antitoxin [Xanthomonadaceae bacterium]